MKVAGLRTMSDRPAQVARAVLMLVLSLMLLSCGGGGVVPYPLQVRALSPEFTTRKAVAYSPFRTNNRDTETVTAAMIQQDLNLLVAGKFGLIRLFDSSDKVSKLTLQVIRANNLDIKVQLGAYIQSDKYAAAADKPGIAAYNQAELARAVALANAYSDIVLAVSVGNETMVSWSFNPIDPKVVAGFITTVRNQITQPVTTDDNWAFWANAPETIVNVVDFASLHTYPELDSVYAPGLWDWQQTAVPAASRAAAMMDASIDEAQRQYNAARSALDAAGLVNTPITIGETGWNAVNDLGALTFRAHPVNQKMYYDRLITWAAAGKTGAGPKAIFYFEAFDEPWKGSDDGWGLFNVKRQARYVIQALNPPSATWVYEPGSYTAASALYFVPAVVNSPIVANKYTLFSEAPLTASEVRPTGWTWGAFDGTTANYPTVSTDAAPGDGTRSIQITPKPAGYGWGLLLYGASNRTDNLSNFASGTLNFSVKTTYPGKIEIELLSDTQDRTGATAHLQIGNGDYGYCNTGIWCAVSIPLKDFLAANPKLDLSLVNIPFVIADIYADTGKPQNSNITTKLNIDAIYWLQ
jgi:exo-beta-1,3-glucanase (GH17 family)